MSLNLIVCDDHALFREGLTLLLNQQSGWRVIAEAANGAEAVRLAAELRPDIAVLDVAMPIMSGIDAALAIREVSPDTRIVALSMYSETHYRRRMLESGAMAYVLKNEASADLIEAIETVLRDQTYISPSIIPPRLLEPERDADRAMELLSAREREVLRMVVEGMRTREIASTIGISAKTVETYRARIMQKLKVDNLASLIRLALRAGYLAKP